MCFAPHEITEYFQIEQDENISLWKMVYDNFTFWT